MPSLRIIALVVLLRLSTLAGAVWLAHTDKPLGLTVTLLVLFAFGKPAVRFPVLPLPQPPREGA